MGAEADLTWTTAPTAPSAAGGTSVQRLRDYGRLGVLLANNGALNGRDHAPGLSCETPPTGTGSPRRSRPDEATVVFRLRLPVLAVAGRAATSHCSASTDGHHVDPELKLVMVHTAAAKSARVGIKPGPRTDALWRGVVRQIQKLVSSARTLKGAAPGGDLSDPIVVGLVGAVSLLASPVVRRDTAMQEPTQEFHAQILRGPPRRRRF